MKKIGLLFLTLLMNLNLSFSQTQAEIDSLLNEVSKTRNSKQIIKKTSAKKIIAFGESSLPILTIFFSDSTQTNIKSECQKRNITKGELAIIIADHIDRMPYALLTGVQNCLLKFCENNPNLIEYYFPWINGDGFSKFKDKYVNWLSKDWIKEVKGKARRKRKQIIKQWKDTQK